MVEEKVVVGERECVARGKNIYLREFRVTMTKLCHVRKGARGPKARRLRSQEGKRVKRTSVAKISGLYREDPLGEGQPSPWTEEFRVGGGVLQTGGPCNR